MNATAWKYVKNNDGIIYTIQVDGVRGTRNENKILKELKEWKSFGRGYDPVAKTRTLMFNRTFLNDAEWKKWARTFPYVLVEIGTNSGKPKPYKLGLDYMESKNRGSKKKCQKTKKKCQKTKKKSQTRR